MPSWQVRGRQDDTIPRIYRAGRANSNAQAYPWGGLLVNLLDEANQTVQNGIPPLVGLGEALHAVQELALSVGEGRPDARTSQVYGDYQGLLSGHTDYPLHEAQLLAEHEAQLLFPDRERVSPVSEREKEAKRERHRFVSNPPHCGQGPESSARSIGRIRSNCVPQWRQQYS